MIYLSLAILAYAAIYYLKTPTPRKVLAQLSIGGLTQREENESVQLTTSLFADESLDEHKKKLEHLFAVKAHRVEQNNHEMLELHEALKNGKKAELEAEIAASGAKVTQIKSQLKK